MSAINITPRILKEARAQALACANRIKTFYQVGRLKSWDSIATIFKISIPDTYRQLPFTWANVSLFAQYWTQSFEARLIAATSKKDNEEKKIRIDKDVSTFGSITLFPEQEGVFKSLDKHFFVDNQQAALQDGFTGSGKTYIAAALAANAIRVRKITDDPKNAWRLHPVIIFCPKGVAENWRRVIESFGLADLLARRKILVFSDSEFDTNAGKMFVDEHEDFSSGEISIVWNPVMTPILAIVDECHRYVNIKSYRTKCIEALIKSPIEKKLLFMSATPMEKINDSFIFAFAANCELLGVKVDRNTFNYFAGLLDATPHKPNREALKRLRNVLSSHIFSIPYVKPKHKAINVVQLIDFQSPAHAEIYESAHQRYLEACRKSGKNTMFGRFEAFVALANYRKTVEPLRAYWIAKRCAENYHSGKLATAVGTAFKETIVEVAFQLVDKYNIPRDRISIVWGGKKEYKQEDLLSRAELDSILKNPNIQELLKNRPLLKKVRITLRYLQDQLEHSETAEEQAYRHNKLRELSLVGKQSDNKRQVEIDKYQNGQATIALFTNASGGIGLSFDRDKEFLLPREGLFTPVYSGKEFQQVLGRLVRRASLSDAIQRICMMRNTVEEFHVAPILDEKLKCIAEITNRNFDIIDLLARETPAEHAIVRDESQASVDAENDDTIVGDFVGKDEEEDDEEEEILA